ncbi:hypothetical protein [Cellulomonas sp. HZM]|uniref:hypothetical protein n=1 Tax=Cellulomonas sp. HZM TaxID=1454010 RepID=UPI000493828C|nr:hypothetical protein [Cellulomonas sp. HZM]
MAHDEKRSGRVAAGLMLTMAGFQAALAAGAPWGAAAYGGATSGTLDPGQRVASAVAVPVYLALATVAAGRIGSTTARRRVLRVLSLAMAAGAVLNVASPSLVERVCWVPFCVVAAVASWRAAPRPTSTGAGLDVAAAATGRLP